MQKAVQGHQVGLRSGQRGQSAVGHVVVVRGPELGHARSQKVQRLWTALESFDRLKTARGILVQVRANVVSMCAYDKCALSYAHSLYQW